MAHSVAGSGGGGGVLISLSKSITEPVGGLTTQSGKCGTHGHC